MQIPVVQYVYKDYLSITKRHRAKAIINKTRQVTEKQSATAVLHSHERSIALLGCAACMQCTDVAYCHRCSVVCVSVCLCLSPIKMAKTIEVPFGIWTWMDRMNYVLGGGPGYAKRSAILGASHGPLWSIENIRWEPKLFNRWQQQCSLSPSLFVSCRSQYWGNLLLGHITCIAKMQPMSTNIICPVVPVLSTPVHPAKMAEPQVSQFGYYVLDGVQILLQKKHFWRSMCLPR